MSAGVADQHDGAARARQRRLGSVLAYVQIALGIAIALVYTPFLVRSLGQSDYGLFAIAGALAAYLVILDMGLADSVVRRLVALHEVQDGPGEQRFLGSMLTLYGAIGALIIALTAIAIAAVPAIFGATMTEDMQETLQATLIPLGVSTAIVVCTNPIHATIVAYERFVFLRSIEMSTLVVVTGISVLVLLGGGGVVAVVAMTSAGAACAALAKWFVVARSLGLRITWSRVDVPQVRSIAAYAAPIFVSMVVEQIFWKLDHILIGARLGAGAVAVYAIGVMFNKYFMSFATAISRVMMPDLVRRIDAGSDVASLTARLVDVSRWQAMVLMLVLSGLLLFGQDFIALWIGPGYELSYWVMLATLGPYALELIGNVRNIILQVRGLYWWRAGIFLTAALLNIPATLYAIDRWGLVGAAICTGVGILAAYLGVAWVLSKKAGLPMLRYLRGVWSGVAPAAVLALVMGVLLRFVWPGGSWGTLAMQVGTYSVAYAASMWLIGLRSDERLVLRGDLLRWRT